MTQPAARTRPKPAAYAAMRNVIWGKFAGMDSILCLICDHTPLTIANCELGHIQSDAEGGAFASDNLVPICGSCNKSIGKKNMILYARSINDGAMLGRITGQIKASRYAIIVTRYAAAEVKNQPVADLKQAADAKPVAADAKPVAADVKPVAADVKPVADVKPAKPEKKPRAPRSRGRGFTCTEDLSGENTSTCVIL